MKRKIIAIAIALLVIGAAGYGGYRIYKNKTTQKSVNVASRSYTEQVIQKDLSVVVQGTGSAYVDTTKKINANNSGTLSGLSVKVGDKVTKGQTLFTCSSDDLTDAVTQAENDLEKQKLSLQSDEDAEKTDDNKIAMDKIEVSNAENKLAQAEEKLAAITVTSPIAGIVTEVNNENGDTIGQENSSSVVTVVDMNSMKIKMSVDELDISKLKNGQKAQIKFDAIENKTYTGKVETISQVGTTNNNVTDYDVVISIDSPDNIKIGMNGNVTITTESKSSAVVIPAEALIEKDDKKYVKVQNSSSDTNNNSTSLVEITTGVETQDYIEVTKGLNVGDAVVISLPNTSTTTDKTKNTMGSKDGMNMMNGMQGGFPGGSRSSGNASGGMNRPSSGKN